MKRLFLSYPLDNKTPTYGNKNRFEIVKKSSILNGDIANDSLISTTVHIGTHIDMPYHFFENGQTVEDYDADFFCFEHILFIEIKQNDLIIKETLISKLDNIAKKEKYTLLIVKTGICHKRDTVEFWESNYGFDPCIASYLRINFPNIRIIGFDSISVSSFTHRPIGREAHKAFLHPDNPILLLEDMDLREIDNTKQIIKIIVAPIRISDCDGLPCTVIAEVN